MSNPNTTTERILSLSDVRDVAFGILKRHGMNDEGCNVLANLIMNSERDGPASHGLAILERYSDSLISGWANGLAEPTYRQTAPAVLHADGDNGYFQIVSERFRDALADLSRSQGVAIMTCRNVHHIGALRFETEPLAEQGLIAVCVANSRALVVPHGGQSSVFGTNPMSFACPRDNAPPIVWDQAASMIALMDIKLAAQAGETLPIVGGLDTQGNPTDDAREIEQTLNLLPFAGAKGTSIALMIEIMAAALAGGSLSTHDEDRQRFNALNVKPGVTMIAIDPTIAGQSGFQAYVAEICASFQSQPNARIPGDGRLKRRIMATEQGVRVPEVLVKNLEALLGAPLSRRRSEI